MLVLVGAVQQAGSSCLSEEPGECPQALQRLQYQGSGANPLTPYDICQCCFCMCPLLPACLPACLPPVIRYDLEYLGLCPCMVDVEIIDAKNDNQSIFVSAGPEACICSGKVRHGANSCCMKGEGVCSCLPLCCSTVLPDTGCMAVARRLCAHSSSCTVCLLVAFPACSSLGCLSPGSRCRPSPHAAEAACRRWVSVQRRWQA